MFHPKVIFRIIGILLFIEAAFLSGSIGVSLYYGEDTVRPLLYSFGIIALLGLLLVTFCNGGERNISRKDGYVVVTLCWIVFSLFGTLPYILSGSIPSFTDAFFLKLFYDTFCCNGIAQEQCYGVFIIYKIA